METVAYVYKKAHVEIPLSEYHDIAALKRDHENIMNLLTASDPFETLEFDKEEDAVAYLDKNSPEIDFSGKMGNAVPYVLVTGAWVESLRRETDENGDTIDEAWVEDIAYPVFPPDTVMNSRDCEVVFEAAFQTMDDEIREELYSKGYSAQYDPQEFFNAYAEAHEEKFGKEWAPYSKFAW